MINAHPGLPEFDYIRPATLAEASRFLAEHPGEARPFMGGTDMFVRMRDGAWAPRFLVDVKHLEGLQAIEYDPTRGLTLGAAVNMNRVIAAAEVQRHYPLLAQAARTVASYALRSRATIAGNACNASPAGDTLGACLVYDASLNVHGPEGTRTLRLREFFLGPGKTALRPGDVVTALTFPPPPAGHAGQYSKLGRNALSDLAIVGVTAYGYPDASAASGYRFLVALASVAPVPLLPAEVGAVLAAGPITPETIAAAAVAAMRACSPISDVRGGAGYRGHMVRNLTRRALTMVWQRLTGGTP